MTNDNHPHEPAVSIRGLRKTWPGGAEAVRGIDLDVAPGEVFGLLGPNGAGKSTTIGMLTTTVVPSGGTAAVAGHDVATEPLSARAASAVLFQDAVVDRALSGRRNLHIHARLWGVPRTVAAARIVELAPPFGLTDLLDRPVSTYSGGQRRRLEIARALLSNPRVLFLDEPTVGLDPRIRFELLDLIARLRDRSAMTVVLTTHYLDEAERLCDRIAVMHEGRIMALDSPSRLLAGVGREVLELRVDGDPGQALAVLATLRAEGIAGDDALAVGTVLIVPLHDRAPVDAAAALARLGLRTGAVTTRLPTLDDVYLRLTGSRLAA